MPKIVGLDKGNVILQGDRPTLYLNYDKQQMGGYKKFEQCQDFKGCIYYFYQFVRRSLSHYG